MSICQHIYFLAGSDSQISYSDPAMESYMLAQRKQLYGKLLNAYLVQSILNIVAHSFNEFFFKKYNMNMKSNLKIKVHKLCGV